MGHTVIRTRKRASAGWRVQVTRALVPIVAVSLLGGCNNEEPTDLLLAAEREAPIGWVKVRLFRDSAFALSLSRHGWQRGTFQTRQDTFYLNYNGETDTLRNKAVLRGEQLCFLTEGDACSDFAEITYRRPEG